MTIKEKYGLQAEESVIILEQLRENKLSTMSCSSKRNNERKIVEMRALEIAVDCVKECLKDDKDDAIISVLRMLRDVDDECAKRGECVGCQYYDSTICAFKMAICTHIASPIDKCNMLLEELETLKYESKKD